MRFAMQWFLVLWLVPNAVGAAGSNTIALLQARLSEHLAQSQFAAATWGVLIATLDSGQPLFEHNANKLLKPASNAKLYTSALALDRLGPEFRIQTSVHSAARPDKSGTLWGDLLIYGRGDPSFAERFNGGSSSNLLRPLVDAIAAAGVRHVKGDLVGDESYFSGPPFGTQWTWDDLQNYYGAEFSALTVQDNTVDLTFRPGARVGAPCRVSTWPATTFLSFSNRTVTVESGSRRRLSIYRPVGENVVYLSGWMPLDDTNAVDAVSVHRPALWFVTLLKEALARRGISVSGKARIVNWLDRQVQPLKLANLVQLGAVSSPPLSSILPRMMKPSQNLYAHLLLLQVGARHRVPEALDQTTEEMGLAELGSFLDAVGIRRGDVLLEEGSGLSRGALVTPNATVALLRFMHRHRSAETFRAALPVAGVDGTLRNRMKGTFAAGNVQAKTGTLRYVNALSGYVTPRAGEKLVFSLMLNNYDGQGARAALDRIAVMLAELDMAAGNVQE
jgi:D-alanyl-D-alanine carboxypeptidase/D-alanyl-D-alanine-endopeptidase (penicillin-binding protein 4)